MTNKKLERKVEEKKKRKDLIIDTALSLLSKKGMTGFTMEDVALEAGFTKRTIYAYFKSKEYLLKEIVLKGFKIYNRLIEFEIIDNPGKNGLEKVQILGEAFLKFYQNHSDYFKAISEYENRESDFSDSDPITIECYSEGEKIINYLKQIISEGIKDKTINENINVELTAILLWASISGVINLIAKKKNYINEYYNINSDELIKESFMMMNRILK